MRLLKLYAVALIPFLWGVFLPRPGIAAVNSPWDDPAPIKIMRTMSPGDNPILFVSPAVFRWSRSQTATRYLLKLAKFDKVTGTYVVKQKTWIPQPASGMPNWRPPAPPNSVGNYRWSVTDYAGVTPGYSSMAYFRLKMPPVSDYLVIDLSGGTDTNSYPVTYLSDVPAGGWTDVYKTTKLVMRRIQAGKFTMGSPTNELGRNDGETRHRVTLTKTFYIGVFEVTQRQWELVMGNRPSYFYNHDYYASRPVETVSYYDIREGSGNADDPAVNWPSNSAVSRDSFMGRLRTKSGLTTLDLPTESQWEFACRAGTATALNTGLDLTDVETCPNMAEAGRYWNNGGSGNSADDDTSRGTAGVGSFLPNSLGLYDMHGNVWEWCLDWYGPYPGTVSDPRGLTSGIARVARGGSWGIGAWNCRSASRIGYGPAEQSGVRFGFRSAMTLP